MLTVVTVNSNRDLTTLAAVKAELANTDAVDAQISKWITRASGVIEAYCNRVFAIETVAETILVRACSSDLMLSRYPITEVVSVTMDGKALASDDYDVEPTTGIVWRADGWWLGKVVITYKAGFTLPTGLPGGIEGACINLVKQYAASGDRDPMVREESDEGVGSTGYFSGSGSGLPPEVEGLICLHRRPNS